MTQDISQLYPTFFSRLYVWLRSKILPIQIIDKELLKNGTVLDIGCGFGFTTIYFALSSPKRSVKGIELVPDRIDMAKRASVNINNLDFQVDDLAGQQSNRFDSVVAIDLLHHLNMSQKKQVLLESYQLLNKNGQLIVKDINTTPFYKFYWNYLHDLLMTRFASLEFLSSEQMCTLLRSSGFKVVKKYPINGSFYPHYIYVCHKI